MRIFPTTVKRTVTQVFDTVTNVIVSQKPAIALTTHLQALLGTSKAGVAVSQGDTDLMIAQKPALAVTTRVDSAEIPVTQKPAVAVSLGALSKSADVSKPAVNMTQIVYSLSSQRGANSVSESAVGGRTDWANDNNALGVNDSTMATMTGNAVGARGGQLDLTYANFTNKSELTITSVVLKFYGQVSGAVGGNADVQLKWSKTGVGGAILLETTTGNVDFRATPKTFDVTASITGWADLDAISAHVYASAAVAETWVASLDAVVLEVTASRTDSL